MKFYVKSIITIICTWLIFSVTYVLHKGHAAMNRFWKWK